MTNIFEAPMSALVNGPLGADGMYWPRSGGAAYAVRVIVSKATAREQAGGGFGWLSPSDSLQCLASALTAPPQSGDRIVVDAVPDDGVYVIKSWNREADGVMWRFTVDEVEE